MPTTASFQTSAPASATALSPGASSISTNWSSCPLISKSISSAMLAERVWDQGLGGGIAEKLQIGSLIKFRPRRVLRDRPTERYPEPRFAASQGGGILHCKHDMPSGLHCPGDRLWPGERQG